MPPNPRTRKEVERLFPLADLVPGWFFRVEELSAGCWRGEGTDLDGRGVAVDSSDPDEALDRCKSAARAILARMRSGH